MLFLNDQKLSGRKRNRTKNNAAKETEEQENDYVVVEFPNDNSKVEALIRSNPEREAITSERLNSDQFSTPAEVLMAESGFTESQPSTPTDEPKRNVGSRTAPKVSLRGKAKTGSESKVASTVNDVHIESLNAMGDNKP